jgi:outer membrane protein OmpA-like peptidoglycan-associated protein
MIRRAAPALTLLAVTLLAAACSTAPVETGRLATMRQQVQLARSDAAISRFAPLALNEAEQSLALAERASTAGDIGRTDSLLNITESRLQTARARADAQTALAERQSLAEQGAQIQLDSAQNRAARLEQEIEGLRAKQTPQGTVFTLTDVLFETGKANLKPGAYKRLQPLAAYLQAHPSTKVTIEGFTDSVGSPEMNQQLSQRRAEAVRDVLIGDGVEATRLAARGMGEDFPVASNDNAAGRQQNRRVEVLVSEAR